MTTPQTDAERERIQIGKCLNCDEMICNTEGMDVLRQLDRERAAAKVLKSKLEHIKEVQEFLGGDSALLDDCNEALAQADEILKV